MARIRRLAVFFLLGIAGLFVLAAGAWIYVTSNVERPKYRVIAAESDFEHRAYPAMVAAEIRTTGERDAAVRAGFRPLAGYIFARERPGDKIAMTAPVTQRAGDGQDWTIQFIMPAEYTLQDLPAPAGDDVNLRRIPARDRAAVRFSGVADDDLLASQEQRLREWMATRGLTPEGAPIFAYYNDPFTPGFLRRNEVIFDLAPRE